MFRILLHPQRRLNGNRLATTCSSTRDILRRCIVSRGHPCHAWWRFVRLSNSGKLPAQQSVLRHQRLRKQLSILLQTPSQRAGTMLHQEGTSYNIIGMPRNVTCALEEIRKQLLRMFPLKSTTLVHDASGKLDFLMKHSKFFTSILGGSPPILQKSCTTCAACSTAASKIVRGVCAMTCVRCTTRLMYLS